jgi:hypothetical protein
MTVAANLNAELEAKAHQEEEEQARRQGRAKQHDGKE